MEKKDLTCLEYRLYSLVNKLRRAMKKPTTKEIKTEIERLETLRLTVRSESSFGDNHKDAIDAQIQVLEEDMSEDEVCEKFTNIEEAEEDGYKQNVIDAAMEAALWLSGETESGSPSEEWKSNPHLFNKLLDIH